MFVKLLNMSCSAAWVTGFVILLRLALRKAPKWSHCLLWALVAVRLLFPFSIESAASLLPSAEVLPPEIVQYGDIQIHTGFDAVDNRVNSGVLEGYMEGVTVPVGHTDRLMTELTCVWLAGMAAMLLYSLITWLRLKRAVAASVSREEKVRVCDYIDAPFILGILRPVIYLPSSMPGEMIPSVLAHEFAHIRRRDHWWKPLGFLLLTVHWFNPVLWLAYVLLCRDIELACDEMVIRDLDTREKKRYSETLLACSMPRHLVTACPLAFGEVGVKERIRNVLRYRKPAFWLVLIAVLVCMAAAVCFLTNPVGATIANQFDLSVREIESGILTTADGSIVEVSGKQLEDLKAFLKNTRLESLPISQNRSEDRPRDYSIRLNWDGREVVLCFDSDFSDVWMDDGVKASLSYRVKDSAAIPEFLENLLGIVIPDPVSGGPDQEGRYYFLGNVLRTAEHSVLVEPLDGSWVRNSSDKIWVSIPAESEVTVHSGDLIRVIYDGMIAESYPAQIHGVYEIVVEEARVSDAAMQTVATELGTEAFTLFDYTSVGDTMVFGCETDSGYSIIYADSDGFVTVLQQQDLTAHDEVEDVYLDGRLGIQVCLVANYDLFSMAAMGRDGNIHYYQIMNFPGLVVTDAVDAASVTLMKPGSIGITNVTMEDGSRMFLPADWDFRFGAGEQSGKLMFRPSGESEGWITVAWEESFGVCGTGLTQESVLLGKYWATVGYYDGSTVWSHLVIPGRYGDYVILNDGADPWLKDRGQEVFAILSTLELACGPVSQMEIISIAQELAGYLDYNMTDAVLHKDGTRWIVSFYRDGGETMVEQIELDLFGNYLGAHEQE